MTRERERDKQKSARVPWRTDRLGSYGDGICCTGWGGLRQMEEEASRHFPEITK